MRTKPQPGEYLFVGGPADGWRQHVQEPTPTLRVIVPVPLPPSGYWHGPARDTAPTLDCMYRLERLQVHKEVFYFYVYSARSPVDAIAALLEGYRREQRMHVDG